MIHILAEYYSLPQLPPPHPNLHLLLLLSLSTAACIAALTTALGTIWRTRALPSKTNTLTPTCSSPAVQKGTIPSASTGTIKIVDVPIRQSTAACRVDEGALGSPRSRFTVSYTYDICDDDVGAGEEKEVIESDDFGCNADWGVTAAYWEGTEVRCRWRGDLGWYRYQNRMVIDGNVVRLWDFAGRVGM